MINLPTNSLPRPKPLPDEPHDAATSIGTDHAAELTSLAEHLARAVTAARSETCDISLNIALRHLGWLVTLIPEQHRAAFLFLCWQRWTRRMPARQRVGLSAQAVTKAGKILRRAQRHRFDAAARLAWQHYAHGVRRIARQAGSTEAPVSYLLFQHVDETQALLCVPEAARALAAMALRTVSCHRADDDAYPPPTRTTRPDKEKL